MHLPYLSIYLQFYKMEPRERLRLGGCWIFYAGGPEAEGAVPGSVVLGRHSGAEED